MANPAVISYTHYGWETSYAAVTTQSTKTFGHGTRITGLNRKNNIERIFDMGERNAQVLQPKKYEGVLTMEWVLSNPWFFEGVLGAISSAGSDPTTHTFSEADTIPSLTVENDVFTDTKSVAKMLGCKFNQLVLTSAVGETVKMRADLPYADETVGTTTSSKVAETEDVFTFAHGSLELPNASTIAEVQNIELTITNSGELIWGHGSRQGQEMPVRNREYSASATLAFEAQANLMDKLFGGSTGPVLAPAETATMELTFTNSLTGANQRDIVLLFTGVQIDEHNLPQDPTAVILEDATLIMRSLTVTAKNATTAAP
jgi:hypothetical protein